MFSKAIVCPPAPTFAQGLTTVDLGAPRYEEALAQHAAYCQALEACGLHLFPLPADERYPDSTFVEDAAIITPHGAILTRPGAASRQGEVARIEAALRPHFPTLARIEAPGTLDGGDICEAGDCVFIGLSERTNEAGAEQLAAWLGAQGYQSQCIDIRGQSQLLHLKSGLSYLGDGWLVVDPLLAGHPALAGYQMLRTSPEERYAANCVRVNERVLVAAGYPHLTAALRERGFDPLPLPMSEFQKMDGGLSCLSLRF